MYHAEDRCRPFWLLPFQISEVDQPRICQGGETLDDKTEHHTQPDANRLKPQWFLRLWSHEVTSWFPWFALPFYFWTVLSSDISPRKKVPPETPEEVTRKLREQRDYWDKQVGVRSFFIKFVLVLDISTEKQWCLMPGKVYRFWSRSAVAVSAINRMSDAIPFDTLQYFAKTRLEAPFLMEILCWISVGNLITWCWASFRLPGTFHSEGHPVSMGRRWFVQYLCCPWFRRF